MKKVSMETLVQFCKTRGFIFPGSDIYGGLANSWDYGPLGVELKNNVKNAWWKRFVHGRLDMVGIDAALIMNPKVWEASGHLAGFTDPLVECRKCHVRFRADKINTETSGGGGTQTSDTPKFLEMMLVNPVEAIKKFPEAAHSAYWICKSCGEKNDFAFAPPRDFNLMFKTFIGVTEDSQSVVYMRPETAQAMFVDFPLVLTATRKRIPFGIAQIGKAFRNEITPGNFTFRTREFEQMEIEYFVHESAWEPSFEAWLKEMHDWIAFCGIDAQGVHNLEVPKDELAHYSKRTVDIEFEFPFGREELYGLAYRTDHDLGNHAKMSGENMGYRDPVTGETYTPHVVEPTFGVDRTVLAMLVSAYTEEEAPTADGGVETRVVLKLPKQLAPVKIAVLPLSKKDELKNVAVPLAQRLAKQWNVEYDETQSIGKRYRRQDEIGTPFCVTVDFDSLNDNAVTVRDRDTMKQERVAIDELEAYFYVSLRGAV